MSNKTVLKELGFSDGEIKVYFSLFELGQSKVGPISKKSGITHAKVYPVLDKLISKGLVSHIIKDGVKHFSATNPNSLIDFVDNKVSSLEEEKERIKDLIPSLLSKQKSQEQTQYSRVFEGVRGIRSLFYELFESNEKEETIYVFGFDELIEKSDLLSFLGFYHDLRKNKKIKLKLLINEELRGFAGRRGILSRMYTSKDKIRYLNTNYPTGVFIFKDHVITIVSDIKTTAFDLKSEQNAKRYKEFFETLWESSKK